MQGREIWGGLSITADTRYIELLNRSYVIGYTISKVIGCLAAAYGGMDRPCIHKWPLPIYPLVKRKLL